MDGPRRSPLTGTTASADVDIAAGNAHATFSVPALLGLTGDLIEIGDTSYFKTSMTADQYQIQKAADSLPVNPTATRAWSTRSATCCRSDGVDPVKGDDVACGSAQCYTVRIELTPAELNALGGSGPTASVAADRPRCREPEPDDPGREGQQPAGRDRRDRRHGRPGLAHPRPGVLQVGRAGDGQRAAGGPGPVRIVATRDAAGARWQRRGERPNLQ